MEIRKDCFYSSASMKRTSKSRSLRTKKCLSKCIKRRKNFDKSLKIAYGNGIIASLTTKKKLFLWHFAVALRKESVDRNMVPPHIWQYSLPSLSARRAWIEMTITPQGGNARQVALRKESVDRNIAIVYHSFRGGGRSPQGERG